MTAARAKERWGLAPVLGRFIAFGVLIAVPALTVATARGAALALPPLTINGAPPPANGPQVNATLDSRGQGFGGGAEYILTVTFPSSNATGDEITAVSGTFNSPQATPIDGFISVDEEVGDADPGALFSFFAMASPCFPVGGGNRLSFSCPNFYGGFDPGAQQAYVIDTSQGPGARAPLSSVNVTVNICGQATSQAIVADNCAPPGPTKITRRKINQHKRTASFSYHAAHAMHYECELIHNKMVKFRAACGSTKKYANPLPRGQYLFVVWGVNAGGGSARAAAQKFKIR